MLSVSSIFLEPTTHSLVLIRSKLVDIYGKFHDLLHTFSLQSDTSGGGAESQVQFKAAPAVIYPFG